MAEWLKATDCKSVLSEYAGSNPASSTKVLVVRVNGVVVSECAGVAQLVELQFSKLNVASSSLVARSKN